jgi:histidine triad (HIT) family protein
VTTPNDPSCIFCKIIAGQIPCHRVLENAHVLAFLDVGPLSVGHTLVIPKAHHATLDALSDDSGAAIGAALPRVARAVIAATGVRDFNILQNNGALAHQAVGHVHFHIIPKTASAGLHIQWNSGKLDAEAGKTLSAAIAAKLTAG